MNRVIIFGASGHGKVIFDILHTSANYSVAKFIDDKPTGDFFCNVPLEKYNAKTPYLENIIIAVGNNRIREKITQRFEEDKFATAIHSSAVISPFATVGRGSVIMPNVSINHSTKIGTHSILNTNCSIDHDCSIGNFTHISPNAALAGDVFVGDFSHIGIGACIIQGVRIGNNVTVGAGSVIIKDIPDNSVVVGNPGRIIKTKPDER